MRFSIITCTYNSKKFLKKNILSVEQQIFRDFEHIFIDGNSTDETGRIIKEYQIKFPKQVKVFEQVPRGISKAMNEGINRSSGEYLIHLHADDSFFDNEVLREVDKFLSNNNWDWVYGKINVVEETGIPTGTWPNKTIFHHGSQSSLGKYILKFYNYIPHQAVFIKKNIFEQYGYFNEQLTSAMDPEMWLRIRNKTYWAYIDRVVSNYTLHIASQSSSLKNKQATRDNYEKVQKNYLNIAERPLAYMVNYLVNRKNRNFR